MNPDLSKFREDSQGRLVPVDQIKPIDLARDELVRELVEKARAHAARTAEFKSTALGDIDAFVNLSSEKYDVQLGGRKGNLHLTTFDGRYKIIRAVQDRLTFDERLKAAKQLIDDCLNGWTEGAKPELRTLITDAFQVDREGQISTGRVLSLRRLEFKDPQWLRAMEAINDSIQIATSKTHLRFYERDETTGEYVHLPLDPSVKA